MTVNAFTILFLVALVLGLLLHSWLDARQLRHLAANRDRVPEPFAARIALSAHQHAADYSMARTRLATVSGAWSAIVLLGWTLGGGLAALDTALGTAASEATTLEEVGRGVAVILSVFLIGSLLELPLDAWRTFGVEQRFGYNRTRPAGFVIDRLKQWLVMLLIGIPLAAAVLWLMYGAGTLWWVYAWLLWTAASIFLLWAYPALIAPLFNRFAPLEDQALRERIGALLERCGFRAGGIFIMDGSRRSTHGNAYFTGLGRNKRIVFFDTLLEALTPEEVEAVLAHELGHFRLRHIQKRLVSGTLISLGGFALLGWLSVQPWFYTGLGVATGAPHLALLLFTLVVPVFAVFFQPLLAHISRKHEFEADAFATEHAPATALIAALVKLYRDNGSPLTPDPLYSRFHDSHPPGPVRIGRLSSKLPV